MRNCKLQIYLVGALTGLTHSEMTGWKDEVKTVLDKYSDMANCNINVVTSVDYFSFKDNVKLSDEEIIKINLSSIKDSDIVIVNTNGLTKDVTAMLETYEAWRLGIPVIAYDENGDYKSLHPWLACCITRVQSCITDIGEYVKELYMR